MSKILSKLFPLIDHLYIYQNFEYKSLDFIKWFIKNPLKRNLQKKHKISWTQKAVLIFSISFFLLLLDSIITSWFFTKSLILFIPLILIKSLYSPLFLIIAQILISPLEYYQKNKIITLTKQKLEGSPDLKVIAITGSFGKTSTKDILYTLLWKRFYVVKTPKSFNTPLGIAQTILEDVKKNTDIFICEVGAYKIGEIKKICKIINPKIGIITAVAPQHLERFGSLENIAIAKFELPQSLPDDGIAILNNNYELIKKMAPTVKAKIIFYGTEISPFFASNIQVSKSGTTFKIHTPQGISEIFIPLIGQHHVQNFLAATAAALQLGLSLKEIKERAKLLLPTPHRMEIKKHGDLTIIDNTYNTNPKSARNSLELLKQFENYKKIIVTPGLIELGEESAAENQSFAKAAALVVDEFVIVGKDFKADLLKGLNDSNFPKQNISFVSLPQEALSLVGKNISKQTVVLLENDLPDQYN